MEEFNVGDKVIYYCGFSDRKVTEVVKVTPTGRVRIKANPSLQFNKFGKLMGGDTWNIAYIMKASDAFIKQVEMEEVVDKAYYKMINYPHKNLDYEKASKILEILKD